MSHLQQFTLSVSRCDVAINGYVADTLPGLVVPQHQISRWHLLNVGSGGEFHAVHFHGIPFSVGKDQEHRLGIFNLYPGKHKKNFLGVKMLHLTLVRIHCKGSFLSDLYSIYYQNRNKENPHITMTHTQLPNMCI